MNTEPTTPIRRCPDGSIDTSYYMHLGRHARSRQAHDAMDSLAVKSRRRVAGWLSSKGAPGGTPAAKVS